MKRAGNEVSFQWWPWAGNRRTASSEDNPRRQQRGWLLGDRKIQFCGAQIYAKPGTDDQRIMADWAGDDRRARQPHHHRGGRSTRRAECSEEVSSLTLSEPVEKKSPWRHGLECSLRGCTPICTLLMPDIDQQGGFQERCLPRMFPHIFPEPHGT